MVSHLKQSRQNLHEGIKTSWPGYCRIQMVCPAACSWCHGPWRWYYGCCREAGPAYGYRLSGISWLAVALQELTWDPQHHTSWKSRQRWYQRSGAVQSQITGTTAGELVWKTSWFWCPLNPKSVKLRSAKPRFYCINIFSSIHLYNNIFYRNMQ